MKNLIKPKALRLKQSINWQKCHNDLGFSPMVTKNGANGDPLAPMVMDVMAPMGHPIAIGTNGDHHWIQWRSPLDPMAITIGDRWRH